MWDSILKIQALLYVSSCLSSVIVDVIVVLFIMIFVVDLSSDSIKIKCLLFLSSAMVRISRKSGAFMKSSSTACETSLLCIFVGAVGRCRRRRASCG